MKTARPLNEKQLSEKQLVTGTLKRGNKSA
jgi:hypothetical protein